MPDHVTPDNYSLDGASVLLAGATGGIGLRWPSSCRIGERYSHWWPETPLASNDSRFAVLATPPTYGFQEPARFRRRPSAGSRLEVPS